jgi:hypothetical protein
LPIKRFGRRLYIVRARLDEFLESDAVSVREVDAA